MASRIESPETVLVYVGVDLVGDGLIKLPFLRALRNAYPEAHITWFAGKGTSVYGHGLAPLVRGFIDEVVEIRISRSWTELVARPLAGSVLDGRRFDLIIDTQRQIRTTLLLRGLPHGAFVSGAGSFFFSDLRPAGRRTKPPSMVRRLLDLVELASGRPADTRGQLPEDPRHDALAAKLLPAGRSYIGLAPGAGGKHKCWPLARFLELAEVQLASGRTPVIFLGPEETDWARRVAQELPAALLPLQSEMIEDTGASPLLTIALAKRLTLAVANDAGVGHMMAVADCPLVSLFGPTPPEKFAPLVSHARVIQAQTYGGEDMGLIPLSAVEDAVDDLIREVESEENYGEPPTALAGAGGESRLFGGEAV